MSSFIAEQLGTLVAAVIALIGAAAAYLKSRTNEEKIKTTDKKVETTEKKIEELSELKVSEGQLEVMLSREIREAFARAYDLYVQTRHFILKKDVYENKLSQLNEEINSILKNTPEKKDLLNKMWDRCDILDKEFQSANATDLAYESTMTDLYDTLDCACALYLDHKIDKTRFQKRYRKTIQNAVDHKWGKEFVTPSDHLCVFEVYNEWFNQPSGQR